MKYPNIEVERARHGLTVKQLTNAIGVRPRTYYAWKQRGNIRVRHLIAMADLFDCSIDYLLGRTTKTAFSGGKCHFDGTMPP